MAKNASTRTTISVPADLKRRMEKVKEGVNWSALACRAFEEKLGEIATRKVKKNMSDVIQRLRASKQQTDSVFYRDGFELGQDWARTKAEANDLERLELSRTEAGRDWDTFFETGVGSAYGPDEVFAMVLLDKDNHDRTSMRECIEFNFGDTDANCLGSAEFIRGFAAGALDVWSEVKDEL